MSCHVSKAAASRAARLSVLKCFPVTHTTIFRAVSGYLSTARPSFSSASVRTGAMDTRASAVLQYWFGEDFATMKPDYFNDNWYQQWFMGGEELDKTIKEKFGQDVEAIKTGKVDDWKSKSPFECLAGIILMDQFTRNMYRGTKDMYCLDEQAKEWANHLKSQPEYESMHPMMCMFVLLPYMHAETLEDQEVCLEMTKKLHERCIQNHGEDSTVAKSIGASLDYAIAHKVIVEKYGRFPHRNGILGRESTPEEAAGLADGSIQAF